MAGLHPLISYGAQGVLAAINFSIERDTALHQAMRGLSGKTLAFRLDLPGALDGLTFVAGFADDGLLHEMQAVPGPRSDRKEAVPQDPAAASAPQTKSDVTLCITSAFFANAAQQAFSRIIPTEEARGDGRQHKPAGSGPAAMQGIRIEGDAALAQKLLPLVEVLAERVSPLQLLVARSPVAQLAQKAVHYAVYEAEVLVTRPELTAHAQSVRALRERIDRLEKRLALMGVPSASDPRAPPQAPL